MMEDRHFDDYFQVSDYREKVISDISRALTSTEIYKIFLEQSDDSIEQKYHRPSLPISRDWIYREPHHGLSLISIDLKYANFQALKYFSRDLVLGCDTWEELMGKFAPYLYFQKSKIMRLKIIGKMGGCTQKLWEFLLYQVFKSLIESSVLSLDNIIHFGSDEIVIKASLENLKHQVSAIQNCIEEKCPDIITKVEAFRLLQIENGPRGKYFVKEIFSNLEDLTQWNVAIKCVTPEKYLSCFKHYFKLDIEDQ